MISPEYGLIQDLTMFLLRRKGELDYGMAEGLPGNSLFGANEAGYQTDDTYYDWSCARVHYFREVLKSDELIWEFGDGHKTHNHPRTQKLLYDNGFRFCEGVAHATMVDSPPDCYVFARLKEILNEVVEERRAEKFNQALTLRDNNECLAKALMMLSLSPHSLWEHSFEDTGIFPLRTDAAFFSAHKYAPDATARLIDPIGEVIRRNRTRAEEDAAREEMDARQRREAAELNTEIVRLFERLGEMQLRHDGEQEKFQEENPRFEGYEWTHAVGDELTAILRDCSGLYGGGGSGSGDAGGSPGQGSAAGGNAGSPSGGGGDGSGGSGGDGGTEPRKRRRPGPESDMETFKRLLDRGALEFFMQKQVAPAAEIVAAIENTRKKGKSRPAGGDEAFRPSSQVPGKRPDSLNKRGLVWTKEFVTAALEAHEAKEAKAVADKAAQKLKEQQDLQAKVQAFEGVQEYLKGTLAPLSKDEAIKAINVLSVKKLKPIILLLSNETENVTSRAPGPGEGKCRINLKQVDLKALAVKWVTAWWQQGKPANLIQLVAPRGNAGSDDEEEAEGGDDDDEAMDDGAGDGAP